MIRLPFWVVRKASMPVKLRLDIFYINAHSYYVHTRLCDHGGSGGALVPPGRGKGTDGLVVAGETVDTGLDENEAAAQC